MELIEDDIIGAFPYAIVFTHLEALNKSASVDNAVPDPAETPQVHSPAEQQP